MRTSPHPGTAAVVAVLSLLICGAYFTQPAPDQPCAEIATFENGLTPTREIHVATHGSNQTGDGSAANPYATIPFAAGRATPGTAIRVHQGVYAGGNFVEDLHGTAKAPIWIGAAPGEKRPILSGGTEGLHMIRPRYLIIHDLEIRNAAGNGLNCDDGGEYANADAARYVVFRGLNIHDIGGDGNQDGLKLSGLNDYFVLDSEFARCGGNDSGSGIDHVGCHRGVIARCAFNDLSANAVQCKGGSEDITIQWCRMTEAGQRAVNIGGSTGFQFFRPPLSQGQPNVEARRITVAANVIVGSVASVAFVGAVDCVVANNTIVTPHNWILRILQETTSGGGYTFLPCADNTFANNLVYFDRSDLNTYVNIGPNTAPQTFSFAHNLWYAYDNPAQSRPTLPVGEVNGIVGRDPRLADPANGDYAIHSDSPAFRAARPPAPVPADIRGVCYPGDPSIGAYEARRPALSERRKP